jgi:hypothetical protein
MNNRFHFEPYTPGMKAKLDPTYRQMQQTSELSGLTAIPRGSRHTLLPFTTANKTNRIIDLLT